MAITILKKKATPDQVASISAKAEVAAPPAERPPYTDADFIRDYPEAEGDLLFIPPFLRRQPKEVEPT